MTVIIFFFLLDEEPCSSGEVRLVDGTTHAEGRVEVCYDGVWGSVCDSSNSWGYNEASVVCLQLGFQVASMHVYHFVMYRLSNF